jgi:hypothetical protein
LDVKAGGAVIAVYGWPSDRSDEEILERSTGVKIHAEWSGFWSPSRSFIMSQAVGKRSLGKKVWQLFI